MINFQKFIEQREYSEKVMNLIRHGNHVKSPKCGNFWDDFSKICNNADALSELLDVSKEKVTSWSGYINKIRNQVEAEDSNKIDKKHKIIKSGE
jgi:hypothetical protein